MGLFDNTSTTESKQWMEMPTWMEGMPQDIANMTMDQLKNGLPPEQQIAGLTPYQMEGIGGMFNYAQGRGTDIANAQYGAGMNTLGMGQNMLGTFAGSGPSQNMGIDMNQIAQYIDNDLIQGQIDAALRDPYRQLTEQQLPIARLSMAGSGNTGSTRGDIGQAILERGYQDRAADISSGIRGNAYAQALGIGAQQASQNANLGASWLSQMGNLGLAGTQGGMNMLGQAYGTGMANYQNMLGAGGILQGQEQAVLDRMRLDPYERLGFASGIINPMATQYGTQHGFSETTESTGIGNIAVGLGATLGGAFMMGPMAAAAGAAAGGGTPSDPRLKTNVRYANTDAKGNRWYTYDIGGVRSYGVMADEVDPRAVTVIDGIMHVNYSEI